MAEIRNAKVLWGGGIVSCTTNNTAEYLSADDKRIKYLSGDTSNPGLLLSAQTISEETVLRAKTNAKNNTDADAFVFDNGMVYVYKTPCTSKMKCKYSTGSTFNVKLFSNNAFIWFMSLEDDKFTVTCDYNEFNDSDRAIHNDARMLNNASGKYFKFKEKGTAEYHFTQKGIDLGQTSVGMFDSCEYLLSCSIPCEMRIISMGTFNRCTRLTSYTENPDFITEIGVMAFNYCYGFTELLIPKYAKISTLSFSNCENATYIYWHGVSGGTGGTEIKCNMTMIPDDAFRECTQLNGTKFNNTSGVITDALIIPSGITKVGTYSFFRCGNLKNLYFNGITQIDDVAFRESEMVENVYGFESVETIGENAFYDCNNLKHLVNGKSGTLCGTENVSTLGDGAFYNCNSLEEFVFGQNITSIPYEAFGNCTSLTSIYIPGNITTIGEYSFVGCSGLTSVTISNGVISIGDSAFAGCSGLTSITIPDSVTMIGYQAFNSCEYLENVSIGNGVDSIGNSAFTYCYSLASITIPNNVTYIGSDAFYDCRSLSSVTIGDGVTYIGEEAFRDCFSLSSLTIGYSVTDIGDRAFYDCSALLSITFKNSTPPSSVGSWAFDGVSSDCMIYVPSGSKSAYTYWCEQQGLNPVNIEEY